MRNDLSSLSVNSNKPFFEEITWFKNAEHKHRLNFEDMNDEDGFHLTIERGSLTLWANERIYIPILDVGVKTVNKNPNKEDFINAKKNLSHHFKSISRTLSLIEKYLGLNSDEIESLLFPYLIKFDQVRYQDRVFYIEGDLVNGKIVDYSVSLFHNALMASGSHRQMCFYYNEFKNKDDDISKNLLQFKDLGWKMNDEVIMLDKY